MALSLANVASPDLKLPYEVANLFSTGLTYAVLTAFAVLFLTLTVIWYRKVPATSSQTAEWFLTAGRNMKSGIVAASIVCTWTWAATLMVSSAKGYQHGIAGPYWYAAGAAIPLLLFAILAIYLKHRAPMAHTFGEFVWHRFGGPSHRLMLCLGLLSCVIVTAMVVLGGAYALRTLTGLDVRLTVLLIPLAFAFYSALGGLRGSIVMEYLQMVVLLGIALVLTFWFWSGHGDLGIYERLSALSPREGETYLTMASLAALLFGIVNTIGNFGTVFMDQTYWQRAIAASDHSAGRSFLIGGLAWFAIPFGIATAFGVGGLALGFAVLPPYTDIAPAAAAAVFGPLGVWLFLIMLFMAIISTGNAESVAVASLVASDLYKTYLRPQAADTDILWVARGTTLVFALLIGPACLALHTLAIDMQWLYLTMGIFVGAGVIPLALGLLTDRLTGRGAYWATLGGLVVGLVTWLAAAYGLEGAVTLETLGRMGPITIGNLSVILTSALICGTDCARPHARFRFEQLRDAIRSYLAPPTGAGVAGTQTHFPASLSGRERRLIGWVIGFAIFLELIVPGGLYLSGIQFGQELFAVWVIVSLVWLLMAAGFIVLLPIKDHYETEYHAQLGLKLSSVEQSGRAAPQDSIGNRLFLSFLTVVLTLGVGASVTLVKFGSVNYLQKTNKQVIAEEALHEEMVSLLIPEVLEERSRGERDGAASLALSERVKQLASSPYTPHLLRDLISSPEAHGPILYLSFGKEERERVAGGVAGAYRGMREGNLNKIGQEHRQAVVLILVSLVGTLALGLLVTIRISAAITIPIRRLAEASGRYVAGQPPASPLPVETADEIGVLTEEFNAMAARISEQMTALKAAEEEFRLIVSHVSDAVVYLDLAGIVRWANHQAVVISGRSMEEMVGRSFMAVLAPASTALAKARLAAIRRGESVPPLVEFEINRPDGSVVWVEANITSVQEDGKVVGRLLVARDITKRKRAEEALRESEAKFRDLVEHTNDLLWETDQNGAYTYCSPNVTAMCGYEPSELLGKTPFDFMPPEDAGRVGEIFGAIVAARKPFSLLTHRFRRKDGRLISLECGGSPILDQEGRLLGYRGVDRDITERVRVEEALRESEERFRTLASHAPVGIFLTDPQGGCLFVNEHWQELAGLSLEKAMGHGWVQALHPDDQQRVRHEWYSSVQGRQAFRSEYRFQTQTGKVSWLTGNAVELRNSNGVLIGYLGTVTDITDRKQAEADRLDLYERLQESHKGLRTLSRRLLEAQDLERRRIARELHDETGQTLTSLLIGMRALEEMPMREAVRERVSELRKTAARAISEIKRLALGLHPSVLDDLGLETALRRLTEEFVHAYGLMVDLHMSGRDGKRLPLAVETILYRITQEALTNVAKHAGGARVSILLQCSPSAAKVIIEDDGRGFDVEAVLASAGRSKHMGLNGMRERAALLSGSVEIESTPGRGTTIYAQVPIGRGSA